MLPLRTPHCVTLNMTIQMRVREFTDATIFILLNVLGQQGLFWLLYYPLTPTPCLSGGLGSSHQSGYLINLAPQ